MASLRFSLLSLVLPRLLPRLDDDSLRLDDPLRLDDDSPRLDLESDELLPRDPLRPSGLFT